MRWVLYLAILVAAILPVYLRNNYRVRIAATAILTAFALVHCLFLLTLHRLVLEDGYRQFNTTVHESPPQDFMIAIQLVQLLSQNEIKFVILLVIAFAILALLPSTSTPPHRG